MNKRVIIIEDDQIQSIALKLLLAKLGYETVSTFSSGELAIDDILAKKPALIVVDIYLNDQMNGLELVTEVRKTIDAPVIFVTGQSKSRIIDRIEAIPNTSLLIKPVVFNDLQKTVEKLTGDT